MYMTLDELLDTVTSYADGFEKVLRVEGMTPESLEELLLDNGIEKCATCGWFTHSGFLVDDDNEADGFCDNCRSNSERTDDDP